VVDVNDTDFWRTLFTQPIAFEELTASVPGPWAVERGGGPGPTHGSGLLVYPKQKIPESFSSNLRV